MIHKYNYKIDILQITLVNSTGSGSNTGNVTNPSNQTLQAQILELTQKLQLSKLQNTQTKIVYSSQ